MAAVDIAGCVGGVTGTQDFEEFYRAQRPILYRALAMTLSDADLAQEAVDEALVRAYQRWSRVSTYEYPAGWVYRVALNWAISRERRRRRPVPRVTLHESYEDGAVRDDIAAAIAALPTSQRAVVVLRFYLDWSVEQTAVALKVPAGTVKSRLSRGMSTLRETLGDDDES